MVFSRARSQALGAELRRRREQAGLTTRVLAERLNWSKTKVTHIESGNRTVSKLDAARYLATCRADGRESDELLNFFRAHDGYWLEPHDIRLSDELINLTALETTACVIRHFELAVVPGLLQTEDYVRALLGGAGLVSKKDLEALVRARKERQVLLRKERPPQCTFFIHENALRMRVGSESLMNDQVLHLMFAADRPHIEIRVVPTAAGPHPGLGGPFQLMGYDRQQPIVYLENEVSSLFLDTQDVIRHYQRLLAKLEDLALGARQSRSWLAELAAEYDRPREEADDHHEGTTLAQE